MRKYDDAIDVRSGQIGAGIGGLDAETLAAHPEGPAHFIWRNRLWRVLGVQARWIESGPWWNGPAVRAARGEDSVHQAARTGTALLEAGAFTDLDPTDFDHDLLCEQEVWRVEAANGAAGSRGVYELAHAWADGSWRLRGVVD